MVKALLDSAPMATRRKQVRSATPRVAVEPPAVPSVSPEELVMRSVNLLRSQDDALRQMAHDRRVSKNDLVRAAVSCKLRDWAGSEAASFETDLERGRIGLSD